MLFKFLLKSRTVTYVLVFSSFLFLLGSCKTQQDFTVTRYPGTDAVAQSLENNDVISLINNCIQYADYQKQLRDYLLYEVSYEDEPYSKLTYFRGIAARDSVLAFGYNQIVKEREQLVLNRLSEMSLTEVALYYDMHKDEHCFIRPALEETILKDIDEYEYYDLHLLHHAFDFTDLGELIDSVYDARKVEVFKELTPLIDSYLKEEKVLVNNYSDYCADELGSYIDKNLPDFYEEILADELPEGSDKIEEYFYKLVDRHFSNTEMRDIVVKYRDQCVDAINEGRTTWMNSLMSEMHLQGYNVNDNIGCYAGFQLNCPIYDLNQISKIQNDVDLVGTALSAASIVAGLFSYGTASLVLDVLDIGRSSQKAQDDANKIEPFINSFVDKFNYEVSASYQNTISESFENILEETISTQDRFKNMLYENY